MSLTSSHCAGRVALVVLAGTLSGVAACTTDLAIDGSGGSGGGATAQSSSGNSSGSGGGDAGTCSVDCAGLTTAPCTVAVCNTGQVQGPLNTCIVVPAADGSACDDGLFCTTSDTCNQGQCVGGAQNDCGMAIGPCSSVTCDETSKSCSVAPANDGTACAPTDLCQTNGTCKVGVCAGQPKDCTSAPLAECNTAACDPGTGTCVPAAMPDGTACNDHDACTRTDASTAGACAGVPVAGCKLYLDEGFETCPDGWTLMGDWQCGTPTSTSPVKPFDGHGVLATRLDGLYDNNQTYDTCTADSPPVDLTKATTPQISFWAWVSTEGGTFDGWNMKVSTDGGQTFQLVTTELPAYPLTIASQPSQPAWGGDLSALGWQSYSADLSAYAGQSITLRYAFRSDPANVYPGVYLDDVIVGEPAQIPLYITTASPLQDAYVGQDYSVHLAKIGGSSNSVWSIDPGGVNTAWLTINSASGVLSGTPSAAQVGLVSVTVHVEEPTLPSNFADETFTFTVLPDVYYTSWEGACPNGWTLTGDWQCGVPMNPQGPATAYDGTQCIGVGMVHDYSNNDTWAATTATSPPLSLAGLSSPTLTFRMWVDTEGGTLDGANLQISTDGGATYTVLSTVTPTYPLTIGGEPAWGGHQAALGWQLVQADLTAYAGMTILLRFGFQSDASSTFPGVYIDDFVVE